MQKIRIILTALLLSALLACQYHGKEQVQPNRHPDKAASELLLQQMLAASGVAQNPTVLQYQAYPGATATFYLVTYTEAGIQTQMTAVVATESLEEGGGTVYVCRGTSCQCLVGVKAGSNGFYEISCSCTSCVLEGHFVP
jgi:hypothetical protein